MIIILAILLCFSVTAFICAVAGHCKAELMKLERIERKGGLDD